MDDFKNDLYLNDDACPNCGSPDCMGDCTSEDNAGDLDSGDNESISSFEEE